MIYKQIGKIVVSNIDVETVEELVSQFPTTEHFLKEVGISYIVLQNIRNKGNVKISTIEKILNKFPNLKPQDLILDFKKEDYEYFNIDLDKYKPTNEDIIDVVDYINANQRTISTQLECLGVEKKNRIMFLIKRLVIEAAYWGVLLEKMNKSYKIINYVNKVRNNKGE